MQDALARFVDSLTIPAERKAVVLAELSDHLACAIEAARREGRDPDAAARTVLAELEASRASLEAVEPAFAITMSRALARGLIAGVLVAVVIDQGGPIMHGAVGALVAIALAAVFAPPRGLLLLRAELRARRVPGAFGVRGVPIGPAAAYLYTIMSTPFLVWIAMIAIRAFAGDTTFDVPWSAFAVMTAMYTVLFIETLRARRAKVA